MPDKHNIFKECLKIIDEKISAVEKVMQGLNESAENDSKSSAGDKHETGRAMIHLEQENVGRQLSELLEQKDQLLKIDPESNAIKIVKGSLVKTNRGYLFLSIALGRINIDGTTVMVISPRSPLGVKLIGLTAKDKVSINGMEYLIVSHE